MTCAKGQIAQIAILVEHKAKWLHIHILIIFRTTSQNGQHRGPNLLFEGSYIPKLLGR